MAMRKKSKAAKRKGRKPVRRASASKAKKPARKKAARAARPDPAAALAAFARKLVKLTSQPGADFSQVYAENVVSEEASGQTFRGLAGLAEKGKGWEQMQEGTEWKTRTVSVDPRAGVICIEWDARVKLRGGPTVPMREVAVHEVKNGKIVAERYYYNMAQLQPPASGSPA
jgi:ketosteroid isomerase-like protein